MTDYRITWTLRARDLLVGKKIVRVQYLTDEDLEVLGWSSSAIAITLDDGTVLYPSMDDEGNDAGALHYQKEGDNNWVIPVI